MKKLITMFAALACAALYASDWMVLELASGKVETPEVRDAADAARLFADAKYKTTHMVFRKIDAGYYYPRNSSVMRKIASDFWVGIYPVTEAQHALMMDPGAGIGEGWEWRAPATGLSWAELRGSDGPAAKFGEGLGDGALQRLAKRTTGWEFDLPTEFLWETVARGCPEGTLKRFDFTWFCNAEGENLGDYAWYEENMETPDANGVVRRPREVGQKKANELGFYDVYGNVWEWCLDSYMRGDMNTSDGIQAECGGGLRICRGGHFAKDKSHCSSINRAYNLASDGFARVGYRLAARKR